MGAASLGERRGSPRSPERRGTLSSRVGPASLFFFLLLSFIRSGPFVALAASASVFLLVGLPLSSFLSVTLGDIKPRKRPGMYVRRDGICMRSRESLNLDVASLCNAFQCIITENPKNVMYRVWHAKTFFFIINIIFLIINNSS